MGLCHRHDIGKMKPAKELVQVAETREQVKGLDCMPDIGRTAQGILHDRAVDIEPVALAKQLCMDLESASEVQAMVPLSDYSVEQAVLEMVP